MGLHTCVASTDVDLTTTGRVRSLLLGATATSTGMDATISLAIRSASRWAESYLGYPVSVQSYQETRAGSGRRLMVLSRTPLRAVARLCDDTDTGSGTVLASSEFRLEDREAGFLSRDMGWGWTVPLMAPDMMMFAPLSLTPLAGQEYKPWLVDYVAGWTLAGVEATSDNYSTVNGTTSTGRTLPEDIEEAVAQRAAAIVSNDDNVVEEQLGDLRVQYRSERVDDPVPNLYEQLLRPYRRVA